MRLRIFVFFLLIILTLAGAYVIFTPHKASIARNAEFEGAVEGFCLSGFRFGKQRGVAQLRVVMDLAVFDFSHMIVLRSFLPEK